MNPIIGEPLGNGPVEVFGSDNSVRRDLIETLNATDTPARAGVSVNTPVHDSGIADLVRSGPAVAKGFTK